MDKWKRQIVGCALTLLLCLTASPASSQETIRIAVGEYPPFQGEKLPSHGIAGHLVSEAYAAMGVRVRYGYFPWSRAKHYVEANSGEWDASSVWSKRKFNSAIFCFSDAFLDLNIVLFHLKSRNFDWDTPADLREVAIGTSIGYSLPDVLALWEKEGKLKVHRTYGDRQTFEMLLAGRFDVAINDFAVGRSLLRGSFAPETAARITSHPKPISKIPVHVIFSKQNPKTQHWTDTFSKGLRKLKESGRYDKMLEGGLIPK